MLADAEGLLTCYGVGEESTGQLTHAVIELCFTSSVRFLQPGLLLQVGFHRCHTIRGLLSEFLHSLSRNFLSFHRFTILGLGSLTLLNGYKSPCTPA